MKQICMAGIDIGGTSIRALICDTQAKELAFAQRSTLPAYRGGNGRTADTGPQRDFDAEILWSITAQVLREAVAMLDDHYSLRSIAVSSCGCTIILLDAQNRQIPLKMSYAETRQELAYYQSLYTNHAFALRTGYPLESDLSGIHLSAFCQAGSARRIARVLSVDDYIAFRLSGVFSRNWSTAASCGMWDRLEQRWLDSFAARTGLNHALLGCPVQSGQQIGTVSPQACAETGLGLSVSVSTGGMDYACAALACRQLLKGRMFNITGTIDLIAHFQRDAAWNPPDCRCINDFHVEPGVDSHMMEAVGALQTEWLKDQVVADRQHGFSLEWEAYFAMLKEHYQKHCITSEIFLPQVFGAFIPAVDPTAQGCFMGINPQSSSISLLRAVLEGMSFQSKRMLEYLGTNKSDELVLVGGGSRQAVWMQIKADVMGRNLLAPCVSEASAVGAALLGGIGCGIYADCAQAGRASAGCSVREVRFNPARNAYYQQVYEQVYLPAEQLHRQFGKTLSSIQKAIGGKP